MASLLGLANTGSLSTSEATIFDYAVDLVPTLGGSSTLVYSIKNNNTTNIALIRAVGFHGAANYFPIQPGDRQDFLMGPGVNKALFGKSSASSVSISGGVTGSV